MELLKMGDLAEEARFCANIFKGFVSQEQAQQTYRELNDDSRSYPPGRGKVIAFLAASLKHLFLRRIHWQSF
jgi:hypothetical protein